MAELLVSVTESRDVPGLTASNRGSGVLHKLRTQINLCRSTLEVGRLKVLCARPMSVAGLPSYNTPDDVLRIDRLALMYIMQALTMHIACVYNPHSNAAKITGVLVQAQSSQTFVSCV